jgi:hypothetical protein
MAFAIGAMIRRFSSGLRLRTVGEGCDVHDGAFTVRFYSCSSPTARPTPTLAAFARHLADEDRLST